ATMAMRASTGNSWPLKSANATAVPGPRALMLANATPIRRARDSGGRYRLRYAQFGARTQDTRRSVGASRHARANASGADGVSQDAPSLSVVHKRAPPRAGTRKDPRK